MQSIDSLVSSYGLVALFIGCFLEGESVAITGGVLAHRHLLVLWQVVLVVWLAAFCADAALFALGRRFRAHPFVQRLIRRDRVARMLGRVNRHPQRFAASFRFVPGLRIVGPLALAQSPIRSAAYLPLTAAAALVWALIFTALGHGVGTLLVKVFGPGHRTEHILIAAGVLCVVVAAVILLHLRTRWRGPGAR